MGWVRNESEKELEYPPNKSPIAFLGPLMCGRAKAQASPPLLGKNLSKLGLAKKINDNHNNIKKREGFFPTPVPVVSMSTLKWMGKESLWVCRQAAELNQPDKCRQVSLSLLKNMFPSRRLIKIKHIKMSSWLFSKSSICFKICSLSCTKKYSLQHCETAFALEVKGGSHSTCLRPPCIQIRYSCLNKLSDVQIDIYTTFATLQYCANLGVILIQCKYYFSCMKGNKYWWIINCLLLNKAFERFAIFVQECF